MATHCETLEWNPSSAETAGPVAYVAGLWFGLRALVPLAAMRLFGTAPETGSALRLAVGFAVLALAALELLHPRSNATPLLRLPPLRWVFLYIGFAAASFLWGTTAAPLASFAYLCGTAADVAIVLLLLRSAAPAEIAPAMMRGYIVSACMVAAAAWIMPAEYDLRLGDQDFYNANTIANVCAFGIYFAQYLIRRKHGQLAIPALFLAFTLLRSLSKATIAAFLLSQAVFLIQDRAMSRKAKFALTAAAGCCVFLLWGLFEAYYDLYTTTGNQAETLTGRTAIWAYVIDAASQSPWLGHGFDSMWKVVPAFGTFEARHAENELLQQVYSFGLTGIVLLCGAYGSLYRAIRRIPSDAGRLTFHCLLLFVAIRGLTEAEPFDLLLPLWCITLIAALSACRNADGKVSP